MWYDGEALSRRFLNGMTIVSKSVDIWDVIVNPIYRYGFEKTPDINPIYVGLERSCPRDTKNVSYVGIGLV